MKIHSKAPTRIDLAGGTVDLWPLYLFIPQPTTLNLAIDLFAEATLEQAPARDRYEASVHLRSEDQGIELKLPWAALWTTATVHPALELHFKLLKFFARERMSLGRQDHLESHLSFSTKARSPAGAGLGGSSALNIAMTGALASWSRGAPVDPEREGEALIEISRDIETTVIQVPAGLQDYYGAMFGGLQALRWMPGRHQRERLPEDILSGIESRMLLFYSGQSRNSGINNWALFKGFIDKQEGVRAKFEKIAAATHSLEKALRAHDWTGSGRAIADEWATRRTLAEGISTSKMDAAFTKASEIAPVSGKVCGAGGGGCFFIYIPELDAADPFAEKRRITEAFSEQGMLSLPFRAVSHGLEVTFSPSGAVGRG